MVGTTTGSSYFDDHNDDKYYLKHLLTKSPAMTIISVGNNAHGDHKIVVGHLDKNHAAFLVSKSTSR